MSLWWQGGNVNLKSAAVASDISALLKRPLYILGETEMKK